MSVKAKVISLIALFVVCVGMIVYGAITEGTSIMALLPRLVVMGLGAVLVIVRLIPSAPKQVALDEESLKRDLAIAKDWIATALESSGYRADFTLESLKEIDRFFDEQNKEDGILSQNTGRILFALGVYVGETIIAHYGGAWDLSDCKSETHICVRLDENTMLFPVVRVMARYQIGSANGIYAYGSVVVEKQKRASETETE